MMPRRFLWLAALPLLFFAEPALAQSVSVDLGEGSLTGRVVQLIILLTVLSIAPGILMTVTSFTRIVVSLSLLRNALGTQSSPPNMVLISLALFLSFFVMGPTFERAWQDGIQPFTQELITEEEAFERTAAPFRTFMLAHTRESDLGLFVDLSRKPVETVEETPLTVLIPAFMISELRRAIEIGFLLFLPFLIIDLFVASILLSLGLMMLPPTTTSQSLTLIYF